VGTGRSASKVRSHILDAGEPQNRRALGLTLTFH
jgi:hypothetical protein